MKSRLISYLQKIRFSPIIKILEFWHKNLWKNIYVERHLTCTDMFCWSFFQIFYLNEKNVRALWYPLFCLLGHALRRLWNPVLQLKVSCINNDLCRYVRHNFSESWHVSLCRTQFFRELTCVTRHIVFLGEGYSYIGSLGLTKWKGPNQTSLFR